MFSYRTLRIIEVLLLPGVVVHELAHALAVWLTPGVELVEVDLTSHVRHRGRYTVTRVFFISYAPLLVNSAVALGAAYWLTRISPFADLQTLLLSIGLAYLAVAAALTAFPSYRDAINPVSMLRRQLFTRRGIILLPLSPLILVVAAPGVAVTYLCRESVTIRFGLGAAYTITIVLIGLGIIEVPTDPDVYLELAEQVRYPLNRLE